VIVVADTGPLNYLVLIGEVDVLCALYKRVIVPEAVAKELRADKAPAAVQTWIGHPPEWLEVRPDPPSDPTLALLDPGERAALALAELLQAEEVLIDDLDGRREAERRHLHITGTLGVLAEAHFAGLLDFDQMLMRLHATNFRLSPEIEKLARRRLEGRQNTR
jgi:predicted nucleic acid-binding protein